MKRTALIAGAMLALLGPSWGQAVVLRHKLAVGETLTYAVTLSGNGTVAAMGENQPLVMRGTLQYSQRCLSVDAQGNMEIRTTCSQPKIAAMWGEEVLPVPVNVPPITVLMAPTGKILRSTVERPRPTAAAAEPGQGLGLTEALSMLGPLLKELGLDAGHSTLMPSTGEVFDATKLFGALQTAGFPEGPVSVGSQWHETATMDLEHSTRMETTGDSTLTALQPQNGETVATIRTTYETPLTVPLQDQGGAFTLSGSDKGTLTSEFSLERGRMLKVTGQTTSALKMEASEAVGLLGIPVSVSTTTTTKYEMTLQ